MAWKCAVDLSAMLLHGQTRKVARLLVLHATGPRSGSNMQQLAKFLGKRVSAGAKYPHVHTPSEHLPSELEPPPDEPDPNADLWRNNWNGGVPTGSFSRSLPKTAPSENFTRWMSQL